MLSAFPTSRVDRTKSIHLNIVFITVAVVCIIVAFLGQQNWTAGGN